jgi:hypothetical protein
MQMAALMSLWERGQEDGKTLRQAAQQQLDMMEALERIDATAKDSATYLQDLAVGDSKHLDSRARRRLINAMWSTTQQGPSSSHGLRITDHVAKEAEMSIIKSLFFKMMQDRETAIPKAYNDTFEWLFKPHPDADQPSSWSSFPAWIEADTQEIYWITGKPGAGKSMAFSSTRAVREVRSLVILSRIETLSVCPDADLYVCTASDSSLVAKSTNCTPAAAIPKALRGSMAGCLCGSGFNCRPGRTRWG